MRLPALALALGTICTAAFAAGPRTHMEMGQRAWDHYLSEMEPILPGLKEFHADQEAMRAFYAGCTTPDFGYNGPLHDLAEAAHWHPFQKVYLDYLLEDSPPPWDNAQRRRVASFLGLLCHGVGDTPWHFDEDGHKSMLTASKEHDGADHGQCEVATDVLSHALFTLRPDVKGKLWWPEDDLLEVFRRNEMPLTKEQLVEGLKTQDLDYNKGELFAPIGKTLFAEQFPWTRANYENYYFGGVEHGGALSAQCIAWYYARLKGWHFFQNIPIQSCAFPKNEPFMPCTDTVVSMAKPESNFGGEPLLEIGAGDSGDVRCALIRFELSDVAPGTDIEVAQLWLRLADDPAGAGAGEGIGVSAMRHAWEEGKGASDEVSGRNGAAAEGSACTWANAGIEATAGDALAPVASGLWRGWDVTPLVREWIGKPAANHGFLLRPSASASGFTRFFSSEAHKVQADGLGGGKRIAWRPILVLR